jgi:hypothetical protein
MLGPVLIVWTNIIPNMSHPKNGGITNKQYNLIRRSAKMDNSAGNKIDTFGFINKIRFV